MDDIAAEVERLRAAGVPFRNDIVRGPGGAQVLIDDPSGNPIELFQPRSLTAARRAAAGLARAARRGFGATAPRKVAEPPRERLALLRPAASGRSPRRS